MNLKLNLIRGIALTFLMGGLPVQAAPQIDGVAGLKRLENQVKMVAEKATSATVSLISPNTGGAGSGVIISEKGLILTAAHVIDGSREMTVVFPDGRQERATVLGANYSRDAAMAQLQGEGPWPYVEVGESGAMKAGDFVVAMGHPKGYDPTRRPPVRFGRVMTRGINGFITTDCTLIGGDSGGPLFDLSGKVVGIHSHIASKRQVNNHAGVEGFRRSWDKMLEGKVWGVLGGMRRNHERPVLGVFLVPNEEGDLIIERLPNHSPAMKAGLKTGDVIWSIQGIKVKDPSHMQELLIDYLPGNIVKVLVKRGADEVEKEIPLASVNTVFLRHRR